MPAATRHLAVLLGLAAGLFPLAARAGGERCYQRVSSMNELLLPADGAADVPLNTRIWVGNSQRRGLDLKVTLLDSSGEDQPCDHSEIKSAEGASALVLTPLSPLRPNASYQVRVDRFVLADFKTGTSSRSTPPSRPHVFKRQGSRHPLISLRARPCDPEDGIRFELGRTNGLLVADVNQTATLDSSKFEGQVAALGDETLWIGTGYPESSWKEAEPGATAQVRFGQFDLAGNFSGWTEPQSAQVPYVGCGGCSTGSGALPLAALAILGLGMRRRRAR